MFCLACALVHTYTLIAWLILICTKKIEKENILGSHELNNVVDCCLFLKIGRLHAQTIIFRFIDPLGV